MASRCPNDVIRQGCRTVTTLALLSVLCVLLLSPDPSGGVGYSPSAPIGRGVAPVLFAAASSLPQCAPLADLINYGVNPKLFPEGSVYSNGEYFCADTAPEQYHCECSIATTCRGKTDPWGRNIGSCDCCPAWMIVCFIILGIFFFVCVGGSLYVTVCQGRWWCDGYASPQTSLMPRRGPAVSCPPTRPLPQHLFRGYTSADFVNGEVPPTSETASLGQASAGQPAPSRGSAATGESPAFGHDDADEGLQVMQPLLHSQRPPRVRASAGYPSSGSAAPSQ